MIQGGMRQTVTLRANRIRLREEKLQVNIKKTLTSMRSATLGSIYSRKKCTKPL